MPDQTTTDAARPGAPTRRSTSPTAVGLALFVIGLGFIAVDVLPFFAGDHNTPLWLNLACVLAPIGFGLAVWGALSAGRREQRAALAAVTEARID